MVGKVTLINSTVVSMLSHNFSVYAWPKFSWNGTRQEHVYKVIFVFLICFWVTISFILWSSDSIFVRCWFGGLVVDPKGRRGLIFGWTVLQGPLEGLILMNEDVWICWTIFKGLLGLIFEDGWTMNDLRGLIFEDDERSSRAFGGLILMNDERIFKGLLGFWAWSSKNDERWTMNDERIFGSSKGFWAFGLDLQRWMNDERIFEGRIFKGLSSKGFWAWSSKWMNDASRAVGAWWRTMNGSSKGFWAWSSKMNDERCFKGRWGLILKNDERIFEGLLGLIFEDGWTMLQGPLGLDLEERWTDLRRAFGLDLRGWMSGSSRAFEAWSWKWMMNGSSRAFEAWSWRRIWRRTKRVFLILRDLLESVWSFRASRLLCNVNWWIEMNELASYL